MKERKQKLSQSECSLEGMFNNILYSIIGMMSNSSSTPSPYMHTYNNTIRQELSHVYLRSYLIICQVTMVDNPRGQEGNKTVEYLCVFEPTTILSNSAYIKGKGLHKGAIFKFVEIKHRLHELRRNGVAKRVRGNGESKGEGSGKKEDRDVYYKLQ